MWSHYVFKPSVTSVYQFQWQQGQFAIFIQGEASWMTQNEWQTNKTLLHFSENSWGWKKYVAQ